MSLSTDAGFVQATDKLADELGLIVYGSAVSALASDIVYIALYPIKTDGQKGVRAAQAALAVLLGGVVTTVLVTFSPEMDATNKMLGSNSQDILKTRAATVKGNAWITLTHALAAPVAGGIAYMATGSDVVAAGVSGVLLATGIAMTSAYIGIVKKR